MLISTRLMRKNRAIIMRASMYNKAESNTRPHLSSSYPRFLSSKIRSFTSINHLTSLHKKKHHNLTYLRIVRNLPSSQRTNKEKKKLSSIPSIASLRRTEFPSPSFFSVVRFEHGRRDQSSEKDNCHPQIILLEGR